MSELLIKFLASYLLGSIVGSLVVGRLRGGVDIRTLGSGNAGGTNALRTQGKSFALWVLVIDIGKGWIATRLVAPVLLPAVAAAPQELRVWVPAACGVAAIVGHVYPCWHGFRGGKGVATLVGVVLGLDASLLLPMLLTWLAAVMLFGFVGLASMLAAASLPIYVSIAGLEPGLPLTTFGVVATALLVFTHRSNIARMRARTEPRARRLWLFGRHGR
ncbi:MAG: glycerol-3-phosphate acyltransferase PlsY [Gammaproteobacteria bacterium]|nr:glycerol-3-phosphate acyltransferase PlsY [Gammaproteobacteria bacterium]